MAFVFSEASLSRYENNLREPKAEIIARLSKALVCSTDYLLCRTNDKNERLKPENDLNDANFNYINYEKVKEKITKRLVSENIIHEKEVIFEEALNKVIKYGIEAAVEILKLEKNKEK